MSIKGQTLILPAFQDQQHLFCTFLIDSTVKWARIVNCGSWRLLHVKLPTLKVCVRLPPHLRKRSTCKGRQGDFAAQRLFGILWNAASLCFRRDMRSLSISRLPHLCKRNENPHEQWNLWSGDRHLSGNEGFPSGWKSNHCHNLRHEREARKEHEACNLHYTKMANRFTLWAPLHPRNIRACIFILACFSFSFAGVSNSQGRKVKRPVTPI